MPDTMSADAWLTVLTMLLVAIVSGLFTVIVYVIKVTGRWARMEERQVDLIADVEKLVKDKDSVHRDIVEQIRRTNEATDRRLRWLEERWWGKQERRSTQPRGE